jgi:hypothetical protein
MALHDVSRERVRTSTCVRAHARERASVLAEHEDATNCVQGYIFFALDFFFGT